MESLLYHFSEESAISRFVPRPRPGRDDLPAAVWAVDEEHRVNYFFPRECPRIIYNRQPGLDGREERLLFGMSGASRIILVESRWLERIRAAALYRYDMPADTFRMEDESAGYYVSDETVVPRSVDRMPDLLGEIARSGAELRVTPSLFPARDAIMQSSLRQFSIIRFRNAR
ncbi:DUF6886 family protein [Paenibacillus sp. D51F]